MQPTCYMCNEIATSAEHVPPKCIFPEKKDTGGRDYRKNLITVPSCNEHNLRKSDNDEYLMHIILWDHQNNEAARQQVDTKVTRTHEKFPGRLDFLKTFQARNINGILLDTFKYDRERIETELEYIARGLYFHEFHKINTDTLFVLPSSLDTEALDERNYQRIGARAVTKAYMDKFPKKGDNPEIFYYQINTSEGYNRLLLWMVFYGGFEVSVNTVARKDGL